MLNYKNPLLAIVIGITTLINSADLYAHIVATENTTLAAMLKQTMPSIVSISGIRRIKPVSPLLQLPGTIESGQHNEEQVSISIGSGVIINKDKGYIATNSHVVDNLDEIKVTLADQRKFEAVLLGQDPASDLALLKIDAENLVEIQFANSDHLQVGDFVVAIGNPYGFSHTVTSGIVSALGRTDLGFEGYYDFIQTDAAINFGNSGGGLVNLQGELVGINTAIISPNNSSGNIGLGLAIPANMARGILAQLENSGRVDRGPLGVRVQSLNPDLADGFGLKTNEGAVITGIIPNTAAQKAGLQIGDVLLKIDNKNIKDANHLRTLVSLIPINKTTTVVFFREGKMHSSIITIADPNDQFTNGEQIFSGLVGIALEETPPDASIQGVRITKFNKATLLLDMEQPQLQEDDVIIAANYQATPNIAALKAAAKTKTNILLLKVMREKNIFFVAIKAPKPRKN